MKKLIAVLLCILAPPTINQDISQTATDESSP